MIDLFVKLTEKGVDLLRERERSRKKFFEQVVQPLHTVFVRLCAEHISTFKLLDDGLESLSPDIRTLARALERSELFERNSVQLLGRLLSQMEGVKTPEGSIDALFRKYVDIASTCLLFPKDDLSPLVGINMSTSTPTFSVGYYADASAGFNEYFLGQADTTQLRKRLRDTVARFQVFRAEVESVFVGLQVACTA